MKLCLFWRCFCRFNFFESSVAIDYTEKLRSVMPRNFLAITKNLPFSRVESFTRLIAARASFNSMYSVQAWSKRCEEAKKIPLFYLLLQSSRRVDNTSYLKQYLSEIRSYFSKYGTVQSLVCVDICPKVQAHQLRATKRVHGTVFIDSHAIARS